MGDEEEPDGVLLPDVMVVAAALRLAAQLVGRSASRMFSKDRT